MTLATILLLLPVVSLLLAAWLCLPQVVILWRGARLEHGFLGGPEDVAPYWLHEIDEDLFDQLTALGFRPVGRYWEKVQLSRTFDEFVFASPEVPGFGMLYRNSQIMPRRAAFMTVFTSGAVVFTKNYQGGLEAETEDFIAGVPGKPPLPPVEAPRPEQPLSARHVVIHLAGALVAGLLSFGAFEEQMGVWVGAGLAAFAVWLLSRAFANPPEEPADQEDLDFRAPLDEVLRVHRHRVAGFVEAGHVPVPGAGPEGFLEIQRRYYEHPLVRREFLASQRVILGAKLVYFALVPGLLACWLGPDHPAPWACLLAEGLVMLAVRYGLSSAGVIKLLRRLGWGKVSRET
jgi:hypothetical protein